MRQQSLDTNARLRTTDHPEGNGEGSPPSPHWTCQACSGTQGAPSQPPVRMLVWRRLWRIFAVPRECARPWAQQAPTRLARAKVPRRHCFRTMLRPRSGALRFRPSAMLVAHGRCAQGIGRLAIPLATTIQARICCRCDENQPCYGRVSWMVSLGSSAADQFASALAGGCARRARQRG